MIVSLSGKPGSGKSTIGTKLAQRLGYKRYYVGDMRRRAARERGMTLAEFNKFGESSDETDRTYDDLVKKLGMTEDNFVIESRTAFLFIPHSLKIFLDVSDEEGAKRIWKALESNEQPERNESKNLTSYDTVLTSIRERLRSDAYRYQKYYSVDIFDKKYYDLFLDTTTLSIEQVFSKVAVFVQEKLRQ